jgi:4-amino-4-deoxy-L-arabinose transferase-like glycosyltransferase
LLNVFSFTSHFLTKKLLWILSFKSLAIIALILYAGIGLGPDEAQYWTWSQALDWGYYSKPPGIAWQIWLGTQLFGQTEWGVRSFTVLLAFFQAVAVYQLALKAGLLRRTAYWCGLLMALIPLGILGSFFAITDVGFLLCWTGACVTVVSALNKEQAPDPLRIGGWILAGALFKWPIYLFWIFFFFCRRWYFPNLKTTKILIGVLLSLVGLFPSIWWNWSHDWVTFRHVAATLQGGSGHQAATGNLGAFLGSQALLLSPILFILFICGFWQWVRQRHDLSPSLFFCGFVTLVSLGAGILASCFQKIQGNWVTFAYPTGLIVLGWYAFQQNPRRVHWAKIGLGLSITLTSIIFLFPSFYTLPGLSSYTPPYRLNPFKHNQGWIMLQQALVRQGYRPDEDFLFSDKYQTTSVLSFYGKGQKRAYFLNLYNVRKNQFSYWPSLQEEQQGKSGYFIWTENMPYLERNWREKLSFFQTELNHYFEKVEFLELAPLVYDGSRIVKAAFIFRCQVCKDFESQLSSPTLY